MATIQDAYGRELDLNLLRVFMVVAEEGSITRAAARLYVTQPAVSAAIGRLSAIVGTNLLTRQGRGVTLSSRGTELLAATRAHLGPLVAATLSTPGFDPATSKAIVRLGLGDSLETVLLPPLLRLLADRAPHLQLILVPVQFRSIEQQLLEERVDVALTVADELPRSIVREPLLTHVNEGFVCLYDSRFVKLKKKLTEAEYFAHDHVAISYAGDLRGYVEDSVGKTRKIRVSIPSLGYVEDVVDGSTLLATVPVLLARHLLERRPHLATRTLPFRLEPATLELLWSRTTDADEAMRFVRDLLREAARGLGKHKPK